MMWHYSGQRASAIDTTLQEHEGQPEPVALKDEPYLIRSDFCVPFYEPLSGGQAVERRRRERLNIELCNRVFRISDARDVLRRTDKAQEAIAQLQQRYEASPTDDNRGTARVLFARITAQIRDLSRAYIETPNADILHQIEALYHYIMVDHPGIFSNVRLYDYSEDRDGIIEEAFSEIGKPQKHSLALIYQSRVGKIGAAMAGIHETAELMDQVLAHYTTATTIRDTLKRFASLTARLSGFPTFDAEAYDTTSIEQINHMDALMNAIRCCEDDDMDHPLINWLCDCVRLIDSMQIIRDVRANSIATCRERAKPWL